MSSSFVSCIVCPDEDVGSSTDSVWVASQCALAATGSGLLPLLVYGGLRLCPDPAASDSRIWCWDAIFQQRSTSCEQSATVRDHSVSARPCWCHQHCGCLDVACDRLLLLFRIHHHHVHACRGFSWCDARDLSNREAWRCTIWICLNLYIWILPFLFREEALVQLSRMLCRWLSFF